MKKMKKKKEKKKKKQCDIFQDSTHNPRRFPGFAVVVVTLYIL